MKISVKEIGVHILFWTITAWLIISSFSIQSQEFEMIDGVEQVFIKRDMHIIQFLCFEVLVCFIAFYSNYYILFQLRSGLSIPQVIQRSGLVFLLTALLVFLVGVSGWILPEGIIPNGIALGVVIFYYAISNAYGIGKLWVQSELQRQRLAFEKKEAQLQLLRSRLHPHFLFNVLNNLLSMVNQQANPQLASSIDRLSSLLRYVVYETNQEKVELKKEIIFIQNYADLQLLRFEESEVDFNLEVKGSYVDQLIEPGILIPFVENAFKYGTSPERQSTIQVVVDVRDPDRILFHITNPILKETVQQDVGGTGLQATRERLALIYPDTHQLTIAESEYFKVELLIHNESIKTHEN